MKVKSESEVAQWYLTLSDPMDCSLPGSSVHGIFQARVLEWGAIAFSKLTLVSGKSEANFLNSNILSVITHCILTSTDLVTFMYLAIQSVTKIQGMFIKDMLNAR